LLIEREVLRPLPSLRLEIGPPPVTRKVDRLSCVRFASARYSVPTRLIGTKVRLVQNGGRLLIAEPTGEVVADYPLTATGRSTTRALPGGTGDGAPVPAARMDRTSSARNRLNATARVRASTYPSRRPGR
jgi:hypothetical protein